MIFNANPSKNGIPFFLAGRRSEQIETIPHKNIKYFSSNNLRDIYCLYFAIFPNLHGQKDLGKLLFQGVIFIFVQPNLAGILDYCLTFVILLDCYFILLDFCTESKKNIFYNQFFLRSGVIWVFTSIGTNERFYFSWKPP